MVTMLLDETSPHRPTAGICTDGAHSIKRGVSQYRGIDLKTGNELFNKELGNQTVNISEFLGVVAAIKYIIETGDSPKVLYTDSITAITWVNNKKTASQKRHSDLKRAEVFLKAMSSEVDTIEVRHWNTTEWGEIPADFGNK